MLRTFGRILLLGGSSFNTTSNQLIPLIGRRLLHTTDWIRNKEDTNAINGGYYEFTGPVPEDRLVIKFARSSGPGGQNVNKVNTKVDIRFHVSSADWIPEEVRSKLLRRERNHINKSGELVVNSTKSRSQRRNLEDAIDKIHRMIREASYVPGGPSQQQQTHVKKLTRRYNENRLLGKKFVSSKKRDRRGDD